MLSERDGSPNNKKFVLSEDNNELKDLNNYLPNLLKYLWENPKIFAKLLSNSNIRDIRENLASLIVNNFYENILSSNYIEDNLMYVFALMLKEEINKLNDVNKPELFLDNMSPCGYLLYELRRKNDIQYFFKTVLLNVVDYLEVISSKRFNLDIQEIVDKSKASEENKENKQKKSKLTKTKSAIVADDLYKKPLDIPNELNLNFEELKLKQYTEIERAKFDEFSEKYLATLTINEIKKMIQDNYNEDKNKNMRDYCINQIINCKNELDNDLYYSNSKLMDKLYNVKGSENVLYLYQSDFLKIIDFIEQLLNNLKNNLYLLPYSVKCLCKIISILIQKKFPNINEIQKNAFIAEFLFKQLLIPILNNPAIGVLINNFIISRTTLSNLQLINEILAQFVSGKLFKDSIDSDYTPFNWYFLQRMPDILEIFDKVTKVTLPHFIEELLDNRLDENYKYDYFKENPDEVMFHRSICFNLHDISAILENINKCKDILFTNDPEGIIFKKTFEKLYSNKNKKLLDDLKNNEDLETTQKEIKYRKSLKKEKEKEKEKLEVENNKKKTNYFLLTSLIANDKYNDLFNLQLDKNPNYTIKELKNTNSESDIEKNNIIKVKNFFCSLLYNYRKLIITDFEQGTISNTEDILLILKTFVKSSNYVVDDTIPSEWFIDSLLDYLKKMPDEFKENDFEKLYDEIEEDLNSAIKKLDFEAISVCLDKLKFTKRGKNYYEESIKSTKDLEINEEVQDIIEDEFIPVEIQFKYYGANSEQNIFDIVKLKIKEKDYEKKIKQMKSKNYLCNTIKSFTEKFPNLTVFQEKQDIDIFDMQKELKIPEKLDAYFNLIKDHLLTNKKIPSSLDVEEINDKIYDHVMSKIYDKIFPKTNDIDDKIFSKSFMLSWTEPKHLIPGKTNYVFDSFLPGVIEYFRLIDKKKSPRKKILYMKEIFNSISKVVKFNGGDENTGVDDQMPILNYAFIKAQPNRIHSNTKLMELYIGDKGSKEEGSQLMQLIALCNFIVDLTYKNIYNVTKEEFTRNCNNVALGKKISN